MHKDDIELDEFSPDIDVTPTSGYNREDDVYELARQRGQLVVPSRRDFLALDIDDCSALGPTEANRRIARVRQSPGDLGSFLGKTLQLDSRSGGYHVYIKLTKRLTDLERLVWQAALGSDPLKELLSARRRAEGIAPFSVMFESPENYEKVMEFLGNSEACPEPGNCGECDGLDIEDYDYLALYVF